MKNSESKKIEIGKSEFGILNAQLTASQRYLGRIMGDKQVIDHIYHYTDIHGLLGILESRGLWLSEAIFLNDSEEIYNGRDIAIDLINRLLKKSRYSVFTNVLSAVFEKLVTSKFENRYICSFSLVPDNLEQWRAYSGNGSGICIEFDVKAKTEFPHFPNISNFWYYEKVIYDNQLKYWILLSIIHKYAHWYRYDRKNQKHFNNHDEAEYVESLTQNLVNTFIFFKNPAFKSEKEVRLVYTTPPLDLFNRKHFRILKNRLIPYIATYDTKMKKNVDGKSVDHEMDLLPVTKIIVGPTSSSEETIDSLKYMINELGYDTEIVEASRVPYRG